MNFSCLTCRQRKVKCDRRDPCTNCVKASRKCSFVTPVRGKRKRTKPPKEGLHAKLRRYEELLRSYGAEVEPTDHDASDAETASEADVGEEARCDAESNPSPYANESKPKLVTKNGASRLFDTAIWFNGDGEFHHPEEESLGDCMDGSSGPTPDPFVDSSEESAFLLGSEYRMDNLASLHPPLHILEQFREVYIDRVESWMKTIHFPTFWKTAISALQTAHDIPRSLEALLFAFYLASISALEESECKTLLGESKSIMTSRYRLAARQALINASFMQSSNFMTLQAFTIFLISTKSSYPTSSQYILSGVAIRLARRMGLHRDGESLGLSLFETEMRRRLWWIIAQIDYRTAHISGSRASADLLFCDTKKPFNVEDEDISPDMTEPPKERIGITSAAHSLIRYEVMEFLGNTARELPRDVWFDKFVSTSVSLAEKDAIISKVEDHLETKYLRYCDMSNPLHYFTSIVARSAVCKMKLLAHNPRQYVDRGVKIPQKERDIVFANGIKLLEYGNLMHSNPMLRKYKWQIGTGYLWDTLLYVLIEARNRRVGPDVDRVWQLIGEVFSYYPQIFETGVEPLRGVYSAFGNWTLQVWDDCVAARKADGLPEPRTPEYIYALRRNRRPPSRPSLEQNDQNGQRKATRNPGDHDEIPPVRYEGAFFGDSQGFESYDFSNLLSFDSDPNEWADVERFIAGQSF